MTTYNEMPLAACPMSMDEKIRLGTALEPLLKFLGSPGDWGYESKLGVLTQRLSEVRREIAREI